MNLFKVDSVHMQIQSFNNSALSRSVNLDMDISSPYTEMNVKQLTVQNKTIGGKVISFKVNFIFTSCIMLSRK